MNYLTEFDLDIDIISIVYMLCANNLQNFLRLIWEDSKKRDAQGGITNKQIIIMMMMIIIIIWIDLISIGEHPIIFIIFTNPSTRAGYDTRSIFFKTEFNRFEFRVFLLLD